MKNWRTAHDGYTSKLVARMDTHDEWADKQKKRIDGLESWKTVHDSWAGKLNEKVTGIGNRTTNLENWRTAHDAYTAKLVERMDTHDAWAGKLSDKVTGIDSRTSKLESWRIAHDTYTGKLADRITGLEGFQTAQTAWNTTQLIWNTNQSGRISSLEEKQNLTDGEIEKLKANDTELLNAINKEITDRKAVDTATGLKLISIDEAIAKVNNRIDNLSFDFSDLGIIAAINSLKSSNDNLWNADNYDGASVGANDGKAVRLFKNQFQGLKTHYAGIMKNYFNMDDPDSAIYRLRYSIVAGFEETKELLLEWFTHLLDSGNTTNSLLGTVTDWLEMQNDHFKKIYEAVCIITDWLKLIYQKPPPVVNVTIPEITLSEKGNGWLETLIKTVGGVIETAIKSLGSLLESAIGEVGQLLRDLLDLFGGLIDDLLHLIVPENLDFMDTKFDSTSKKIKLKFGSIFDGIDAFKGMFGSKSVFQDIEMNLGTFGRGSFKLPLSMLNDMAPFVRALITGAVALEFLIDMYKWFHTKGEVIE